MRFSKLIISVIVTMFLNAVSVMYAQSQTQPISANLDKKMKNSELAEQINNEQKMAELQKEEKDAKLQKINEEIEAYKRLVSGVVKHSTPAFGIEGEQKAISDTSHIVSEQVIKEEGDKANTNIAPKCFAYEPTTFASQREILDFIKSIDFDRNPPAKRLCDFYNDEKKITEDKVLRKGIELYEKGKIKKAVDYFVKIYKDTKKYTQKQRDYAAWQVEHYRLFGIMDLYYNGTPSRMDRRQAILSSTYKCDTKISLGLPYLFVISDPSLPSYNPAALLRSIASEGEFVNDFICSNPLFTREFLAAALYEAFPKGKKINIGPLVENDMVLFGTKPFKYVVTGNSSSVKRTAWFVESVTDFFNIMDCMHLVARTKSNIHDKYGIGLTADELYKKGKRLNPNKQMNLTDYNEGIKNMSDNDEQCQILLLRSAYYGHPDAILELMPYIVETVQYGNSQYFASAKFWTKWYKEDVIAAKSAANGAILEDIKLILKALSELPHLKNYSYILEAIIDEVTYTEKNLNKMFLDNLYAKEAEERAKKERRKQFWSNVGTALLNGMASGVNAYMASQYQVSAPMNTVPQMTGNYPGSLADAMSQPGYFQQQQQQLLQLSMNQVQWAEMQEYNATRENYQRMGRDLTLNEFRSLKGQAIANLKEQGYDIIAEQKAINDDIHDFNRSQMNSGKENVERIKKQNADKSKVVASNTTNPISKSFTSNSSAKPYTASKPSSTSTTSGAKKNNNVSRNKASDSSPDAHEQYKKGNVNTQKSAYGDKIKNVSFSVKDGASYRSVNLHGELYKKDGQHFVLIGNSFFKVEHSGGSYNSYIIYGAKAHYFNK